MVQANGKRGSARIAELGLFSAPSPLVSRGKPRLASAAAVASNVGVGPARVFVRWALPAEVSAEPAAPPDVPAAYRVETSASSRDGHDGDWRVELVVAGNTARARGHDVEFDGQSWVRLVWAGTDGEVAGAPPARHPEAIELDVHDASNGTDDTWLVLGDELGLAGLEQVKGEPGFPELVHESYPGYFPSLFNEARAGESPAQTLSRLEALLATHPHVRHVALVYSGAEPEALEALILALVAAKRLPSVARFRRGDSLEALEARHGLAPGPDLRAWLDAHPEQLEGGRRPTAEGRRAIHRLWAEAMDVFYVPQ
jgi:acyl-CoA thioesterase I